ncbi:MAG: malonyl-CoA synthase [Rhodospirillaceae bacterium]|nr:malonyl-CoA synthase [Rhodospirillaceae bacterium]
MSNLYTLFSNCFPKNRDEIFIEASDGQTLDYASVDSVSALYGGVLVSAGVKPGDRVALQVEKSPQAVMLYLATLRVGAVFLPINTAYTATEVEYFLNDCEPAVVICDPSVASSIKPMAASAGAGHVFTLGVDGKGSFIDSASSATPMNGAVERSPNDLAAILYTSGTTGRSKGAMLTIENLWSNAITLRDYWGFDSNDVLLHALPIFHVHGLFVAIHCVLASAAKMIFMPKYDAEKIIQLLPRATVMMGVPTFYTRLLAVHDLDADTCSNMRLFISGSAPLLTETWKEFKERTGHAILERYGMTETGMNTSNPLSGERIPGSVGPALPGVSVRIVDETGKQVAIGEPGLLEVKGPNVFSGYWRMEEKTAEEFRDDGFFITGDIATIDKNGYVSIVGRSKDMIITGGYNVYPKEIEEVIDAIAGVVESAVIGVPDDDLGERVTAVVKARPIAPDSDKMIAHLKTELAGYKVPKNIFFVDDLPRNAMGKVQKAQLRKTYGSGSLYK